MVKLAVYGTLRKGFGNDHYMKKAKFIGGVWCKTSHANYDLSPITKPLDNDECEVELYDIPERDYDRVKKFEMMFGYEEVTVFANGEEYIIFALKKW
jgi:gamma-glutamylcyclotransferase (GGCT)/AIG2-like uncharacterized protein YtfP